MVPASCHTGGLNMRRLTIPAIALAMTLTPALLPAQTPDQQRPRQVGGAPVERIIQLREQLGLTDQQVTELRRIQTQLQEKNRPLREQIQAARPDRPAVTPEQREQMRARMQQLTPEQRDQMRERMQQMTPEQRDQMRERMQQMTPEQRDQMRQRRQAQPGARGIMPDSMRQRMQRATPEERAGMRERMQQLTPEQREQMRERMQQRPGRPGAAATRRVPAELEPVMGQIRENTQEAARQIQATLTEEQRTRLRELRPGRMPQRTR
jgi:hypothetical protein